MELECISTIVIIIYQIFTHVEILPSHYGCGVTVSHFKYILSFSKRSPYDNNCKDI